MRGERRSFEEFLGAPDTEQIHFIGKDIIYFHTLFWPAMLKFAGAPYKVPDHVYVHGFITVSGEKMSKSRGTGISPLRYLQIGMNAEWLRYYIAAKLNGNVEDLDFNPDDFIARVNSDLVGKYVNIASRAASFINRQFAGELRYAADAAALTAEARTPVRGHPRELRDARVRQGDARGHGVRRPHQPRLRCAPALGARQGSGPGGGAAGGVLAGALRLQGAVGAARPGAAGSHDARREGALRPR